MRVAIVGSRDFVPLKQVEKYVQTLKAEDTIITGGARGVDKAAEKAGKKRGLNVRVFCPDWERYGRAAGMLRNSDVVNNCDRLAAFWDGASTGTHDAIRKAG